MCLAIPARIIDIDQKTATVDVGGITKQASIVLLPEADLGDYVLMHAGFAISLVDEDEALETIRLFEELIPGMSDENNGMPGDDSSVTRDDSSVTRDDSSVTRDDSSVSGDNSDSPGDDPGFDR